MMWIKFCLPWCVNNVHSVYTIILLRHGTQEWWTDRIVYDLIIPFSFLSNHVSSLSPQCFLQQKNPKLSFNASELFLISPFFAWLQQYHKQILSAALSSSNSIFSESLTGLKKFPLICLPTTDCCYQRRCFCFHICCCCCCFCCWTNLNSHGYIVSFLAMHGNFRNFTFPSFICYVSILENYQVYICQDVILFNIKEC